MLERVVQRRLSHVSERSEAHCRLGIDQRRGLKLEAAADAVVRDVGREESGAALGPSSEFMD